MFYYADSDDDGMISYDEFQVMVSPPDISPLERPHIAQLVFSPRNWLTIIYKFLMFSKNLDMMVMISD